MKKVITLLVSLLIVSASGFGAEPIKFMGIPVDGTKQEMIKSLEKMGFSYLPSRDLSFGEFNGNQVAIYVQTVKGKVWRLIVMEPGIPSEDLAKYRFNKLFRQLSDSKKYIYIGGEKIDDNEKLRYNLKLGKKEYSATFITADLNVRGLVWYDLSLDEDEYDEYCITMYYENPDNEADGSDL